MRLGEQPHVRYGIPVGMVTPRNSWYGYGELVGGLREQVFTLLKVTVTQSGDWELVWGLGIRMLTHSD